MGQKANPRGLRLGITHESDSQWFALGDYAAFLLEDYQIREFLKDELKKAGVSKINIYRKSNFIEVAPVVARPGVIASKSGIDIDILANEIEKKVSKKVVINVRENKRIDATAQLLASWVSAQLVKRVPFRKAMKSAIQKCLKSGAYGVKIICSGRLAGAEIARTEWYREGNLPLNTLKSDIDFARDTAQTAYGAIGVTVYVNYTKKS